MIVFTIVGGLLLLVGSVLFLIEAFNEDWLWGLACLFFPFAQLAFTVLHWQRAQRGFFIQLAGTACILVAVLLGK